MRWKTPSPPSNLPGSKRRTLPSSTFFCPKDGQIVVIHDKDTKRVAGVEQVSRRANASRSCAQLDVGKWKGDKFAYGEKLPASSPKCWPPFPKGKAASSSKSKRGPKSLPELPDRVSEGVEASVRSKRPMISFNAESHRGGEEVSARSGGLLDREPQCPPSGQTTANGRIARSPPPKRSLADGLDFIRVRACMDKAYRRQGESRRTQNCTSGPSTIWRHRPNGWSTSAWTSITTDRPGWLRRRTW